VKVGGAHDLEVGAGDFWRRGGAPDAGGQEAAAEGRLGPR
jgi:hypothetical protein